MPFSCSEVATAQEQHRTRRTGNYQIKVSSSDAELVALVRGIVYFKA